MMRRERSVAAIVLVLLAYAGLVAFVGTASARGGHLPGFSLMNRRLAVTKLPPPIRYSLGEIPGSNGAPAFGPKIRGPVWFGKVDRPNATIYAAGNSRWVCETEASNSEAGGGGGTCTTLGGAREIGLLNVGSCGKGPPRHFRIDALVPDGVTGIEINGADGSVGRTVPVLDNTVAFTVGRKNISLRGSVTRPPKNWNATCRS